MASEASVTEPLFCIIKKLSKQQIKNHYNLPVYFPLFQVYFSFKKFASEKWSWQTNWTHIKQLTSSLTVSCSSFSHPSSAFLPQWLQPLKGNEKQSSSFSSFSSSSSLPEKYNGWLVAEHSSEFGCCHVTLTLLCWQHNRSLLLKRKEATHWTFTH